MPAVRALLLQADLPVEALERTRGWVAEGEDGLVGHVALEPGAGVQVLRSLVVAGAARRQGLGARLVREAEAAAGILPLVLRTERIGPWVEGMGYRRTTLQGVPAGVRETSQFSGSLCAGTPVYLKEGPEFLKAAAIFSTARSKWVNSASPWAVERKATS